jgi:putative membrane protein
MNNDNQNNTSPMRSFGQTRHRRALMGWVIGGLVILLLAGLIAVPFLYGLPARPYAYYPFPFFFFPFGFLIFLFVIFFAVRALFWGLGWGWGWRGGYSRGYWRGYGHYGDANEILRQRYARGEISKDQFDQMTRDLKAQDA